MAVMYLATGIILVVAMAVVLVYYYSPKRKDDVESAKYDMLRDDPPQNSDGDVE